MTKSAGNLLLIRDSLQEAMNTATGESNSACANILADIGLTSIPPALAMRLIRQRIDLDLD
jgi:hypothetical protein